MKRTFHEFCLGMIDLPDWMVVTAVTVEREGWDPLAIAPGECLPPLEGPFEIRIEVRPDASFAGL